jgi:hypothetical protein
MQCLKGERERERERERAPGGDGTVLPGKGQKMRQKALMAAAGKRMEFVDDLLESTPGGKKEGSLARRKVGQIRLYVL